MVALRWRFFVASVFVACRGCVGKGPGHRNREGQARDTECRRGSTVPPRNCARGLSEFPYPLNRGRREYRVRAAPAVSCAKCAKENAHEHTGSAEAIRHSLRNGFTAYIVLSPVIGLV